MIELRRFRLEIKPKSLSFNHDERYEVNFSTGFDEDAALAMLAGLRHAGYEAHLFAISSDTQEIG